MLRVCSAYKQVKNSKSKGSDIHVEGKLDNWIFNFIQRFLPFVFFFGERIKKLNCKMERIMEQNRKERKNVKASKIFQNKSPSWNLKGSF